MIGHAHLHGLVVGLSRSTWLVAPVTAIVCGVISAHGAAALVDAELVVTHPPRGPAVVPATVPASRRPPRDGSALVARNMFCSTCAPLRDEPGPAAAYVPDAVLIATAIGPHSQATLRVPASEAQGSWELGDTIPGLGVLDRITYTSIDIIDHSGRRGRLKLASTATPDSVTPARAPAAEPPPWAGRIRRIGDHDYEVDRDLVRELVGAGAKAGGGVLVSAVTDDNKAMTGVRLSRITKDSLPAALDLRSGDVLNTINGTPITSANVLLDLYGRVDRINEVALGGTSGNGPLALTLHLK
jgi:hypothetical protein